MKHGKRHCIPLTSLLAEGHVDQVRVLVIVRPLELQLVRVQGGEVFLGLLCRGGTQTLLSDNKRISSHRR